MLCIDTAAVAPLIAVSMRIAATLFFFHIRSANRIVPVVVATFMPVNAPVLLENAAVAGFASRAHEFRALRVM